MAADVELITAIRAALLADPVVAGFIGTRFYDPPPASSVAVPFPYISLGPSNTLPDDYDCVDGKNYTIQLDVWSRGAGEAYSSAQTRKICAAVERLLDDAELQLATTALASLEHTMTRVVRDPDGVTNHGIIQFDAVVELVS